MFMSKIDPGQQSIAPQKVYETSDHESDVVSEEEFKHEVQPSAAAGAEE